MSARSQAKFGFLIVSRALLMVLLNSVPALGSGLSFMDPDLYQACGMTCVYEHGVENLTLQARFIEYRLLLLEARIQEPQGASAVLSELGLRCLPAERAQGDPRAAQACLGRFKRDQLAVLSRIRGGLLSANQQVSALRGGEKVLSVEPEADVRARLPQTPFIPTLRELRDSHDGDERLRTLGSTQYLEWLKDMPRAPSQDEFLRFKRIPRDPSDPENGEMLTVQETDPQGKPVVDTQAYERALKAYEGRLAIWKGKTGSPGEEQAFRAQGAALARAPGPLPKFEQQVQGVSRRAFLLARRDMLVSAQKVLKKTGVPVVVTLDSAKPAGLPQPGDATVRGERGPANVKGPAVAPGVQGAGELGGLLADAQNMRQEEDLLNAKLSPSATQTPTRVHIGLRPEALNAEVGELGGKDLMVRGPAAD